MKFPTKTINHDNNNSKVVILLAKNAVDKRQFPVIISPPAQYTIIIPIGKTIPL